MIEYLGDVKLGGLYLKDKVLKTPVKPFNTDEYIYRGSGLGDIYSFLESPNISDWKIKDTPLDVENRITWHRFKNNGKDIFICDRVLINNISANDLEKLRTKQYVYIDGEKYIYTIPSKDEWKKIVNCEEDIWGVSKDAYKKNELNKDVATLNHNIFWNWIGVYSLIKNEDSFEIAGYYNPNHIREIHPSVRNGYIGFRPVLEKVATTPVVLCKEGSLGEFENPFTYEYSATTYVDNDTLRIVEKVNNMIVKDYETTNMTEMGAIDMSPYWGNLQTGRQEISIEVTNKNNESTIKSAQFYTNLPTLVDRDGLEYFAGKFWNNKIKPFVAEFAKRQGGLILDSGETYTGSGIKEVTNLADNGVCIKNEVNSSTNTLACFSTDVIKLGRHSVAIRMATDNKTTENTFGVYIYKKANGKRTQLASREFKGSDFSVVNQYQTFYMTFDYDGAKVSGQTIEVEIKTLPNITSHYLRLDYVLVSPLLPTALI